MARRSNFFNSEILSQDNFEKHFCVDAVHISKLDKILDRVF